MGVVLGGTAIVLGYKRLKLAFKTSQKKAAKAKQKSKQKLPEKSPAAVALRDRPDLPDLPAAAE